MTANNSNSKNKKNKKIENRIPLGYEGEGLGEYFAKTKIKKKKTATQKPNENGSKGERRWEQSIVAHFFK